MILVLNCGDPSSNLSLIGFAVEGGSIASTNYNESVSTKCVSGSILNDGSGFQVIRCQANGIWSSFPTCMCTNESESECIGNVN